MNKKVLVKIMVVIMLLGSVSVYAESNVKEGTYVEEEIISSISIPRIKGLGSNVFMAKLNNTIRDRAIEDIQEYLNDIKGTSLESGIIIDYDIKSDSEVLSFVVSSYTYKKGENHGETKEYYYNIGLDKNRFLKLEELFPEDLDYEKMINEEIEAEIKKDKENYFTGKDGFSGIKEDQNFYVDKFGNVVIVFEEGEIAPLSMGRPEFVIRRGKELKYENKKYGFSLALPPVWDGVVFVGEGSESIDLIYEPAELKDKPKKIMEIKVLEKSKYKEESGDIKLGEKDNKVFIAKASTDNPYSGNKAETKRFNSAIKVLDGIDELFTFDK